MNQETMTKIRQDLILAKEKLASIRCGSDNTLYNTLHDCRVIISQAVLQLQQNQTNQPPNQKEL